MKSKPWFISGAAKFLKLLKSIRFKTNNERVGTNARVHEGVLKNLLGAVQTIGIEKLQFVTHGDAYQVWRKTRGPLL